MDRIIKIAAGVFGAIVLCTALFFVFSATSPSFISSAPAVNSPGGNVTVYFFYGEECPHCHKIMPFVQSLREKYPTVNFLILETWHNETNYAVYTTLNRELKVTWSGVPEAIVGDVVLIGEVDIPGKLEQAIVDQEKKKHQ
jgi:thiol-disulfide isomerase/thioredoxin|nr:thioredoxin family protein [uncultured Methanoregula sp.]